MRFSLFLFIVLLIFNNTIDAQQTDNVWSLQRCIHYAIENNISLKQDSLNARMAKYTFNQSQYSQLPTLNTNGNYGRSFGRSINPTTNQFVDVDYNFLSASGSANLLVFGWMQVRNTIAKNKYSLLASLADLEQLRDDVSLNIATGFLSALLAEEQIHVCKSQVSLSEAQLIQTKAFAESGRLPELNVAQLESQLATDSSNLINAISNYNSSILDLKSLLNLDMSIPFTIQLPDVTIDDALLASSMQSEDIYQKARLHFGSIKGSEYRVNSAEKGVDAAKGNLYPQLSIGAQFGTNWASNYQTVSYTPNGYQLTGFALDSTNLKKYNVYQPSYVSDVTNIPFSKQLNNNFRQTVSVNLTIPIFNGWQSQYLIRQAKINLETQKLNKFNAELTLKQNVYKAHNNALNSIQKFNAAKHADDAAKRALDFAKKRYDVGLTSTVDFLVTQNSAFAAGYNLLSAKYDLIFKLKVIDYYLGKELKL